jgi:hypothetical protein
MSRAGLLDPPEAANAARRECGEAKGGGCRPPGV